MRRLMLFGILGVILVGSATTLMAGTVNISSSDVDYRVNVGDMYVSSTGLTITKNGTQQKGSVVSGAGGFDLSITPNGYYTDAGILIGFDGSLKLGDLQSLSFSSTGAPIALTLWLDTGGDNQFLEFSNGKFTQNYDGDSSLGVAALSGNTLDLSTSLDLYRYNGINKNGQGYSFTLADLQAGNITGFENINANTSVAIWIGITGDASCSTRSAHISNVQLTTYSVPEPSLISLFGIGIGAAAFIAWRKKR
jgi:hypothetical protein